MNKKMLRGCILSLFLVLFSISFAAPGGSGGSGITDGGGGNNNINNGACGPNSGGNICRGALPGADCSTPYGGSGVYEVTKNGIITGFGWECYGEGGGNISTCGVNVIDCTGVAAVDWKADIDFLCEEQVVRIGLTAFDGTKFSDIASMLLADISLTDTQSGTLVSLRKSVKFNRDGNAYVVLSESKASNYYLPSGTYEISINRLTRYGLPVGPIGSDGKISPWQNGTFTYRGTDCTIPVPGCHDPLAKNFNPLATQDDGSCTYPADPLPEEPIIPPQQPDPDPIETCEGAECDATPEPIDGGVVLDSGGSEGGGSETGGQTGPSGSGGGSSSNPSTTSSSSNEVFVLKPGVKLFNQCTNENPLNMNNFDGCVVLTDTASELAKKGIAIDFSGLNYDDLIAVAWEAYCGDGFIYKGYEECDDGMQNGDSRACTSVCTINVCGDGYLYDEGAGTEQCDPGPRGNWDNCGLPGSLYACRVTGSGTTSMPLESNFLGGDVEESGQGSNLIKNLIAAFSDPPGVVKITFNIVIILFVGMAGMISYGMFTYRVQRHSIRDGETLASVAFTYATTDKKIRRLNHKGRGWTPKIGESIKVPNHHFTQQNTLDQLKEVFRDGLGTKLGKNKQWGRDNRLTREKKQQKQTEELITSIEQNAGLLEQLAQEQTQSATLEGSSDIGFGSKNPL